jgi:protein TonB
VNRSGARWTGWAVTGGVHAAMLLALASAFAPTRAPLPGSVPISARLLPPSATTASVATAMAPLLVALPPSALRVPPSPDIPPPTVQITTAPSVAPPLSAATPAPRFDAPTAAGADATPSPQITPAPMTSAITVASSSASPPPSPIAAPAARPSADSPAAFPADHQVCSDRQTARHYPALLRERGIQGQVLLRVKVDADGRAAEVIVAGGSGWRLLDEAARRVAESCPYLPARRGDQKLVSWVEYPVRFALQPSTLQ